MTKAQRKQIRQTVKRLREEANVLETMLIAEHGVTALDDIDDGSADDGSTPHDPPPNQPPGS